MTNLYSIMGRQKNDSGNKLKKDIVAKCLICEKDFTKKSHNAKYCSKACVLTNQKNYRDKLNKSKKPSRHATFKDNFYFPPPEVVTGNGLAEGSKPKRGRKYD